MSVIYINSFILRLFFGGGIEAFIHSGLQGFSVVLRDTSAAGGFHLVIFMLPLPVSCFCLSAFQIHTRKLVKSR